MSQMDERVMHQPRKPSQPGQGCASSDFLNSSKPSRNMKSMRLKMRMIYVTQI